MRRLGRTTVAIVLAGSAVGLGAGSSAAAPSTPPTLPPAAPSPTASAVSPEAPDPHPQLGGIGPDGRPVGGAELLGRGQVLPGNAPALPTGITAASWVLVDLDKGTVLAAQDPHGRYQPASILKTLTSVVLLPKLPGDTVVTASHDAASAEGSAVGLVEGGRYTVDQLFGGLLLESGNDAAAALSEAAGGVPQTVAAMNAEARELGAYDTYVETPSGLDGWKQLTSAYDMALFLRVAVNNPRFVAYDEQPTSVLPAQDVAGRHWDAVTVWNQSENFLSGVPGALVAKTGFTDAAQHTFLAAVNRGGRRLGVVLLRAQRQPLDQWQQAAALIDWGYALPAGTEPVGTLDRTTPTVTTGTPTAGAGEARPVAGGRQAAGTAPAPSPAPAAQAGRTSVGVIVAGVLLAALGLLTGRRLRRRP